MKFFVYCILHCIVISSKLFPVQSVIPRADYSRVGQKGAEHTWTFSPFAKNVKKKIILFSNTVVYTI